MKYAILFAVAAQCQGATLRQVYDAIREVETGSSKDPANAVGDGGKALGPYQIWRVYWQDSGVPGTYEQVRDKAYAEKVMLAYWRRYCPAALKRVDAEVLARVHNGGPRGAKKKSTVRYWKRVKAAMKQRKG